MSSAPETHLYDCQWIPVVFSDPNSLGDFCWVCSVNMEESHVKCQKLVAEKGLSPCAGRAVLRVTVVSVSSYMESCAYLKSIDQTCRQYLPGVCLNFLLALGAALPVNGGVAGSIRSRAEAVLQRASCAAGRKARSTRHRWAARPDRECQKADLHRGMNTVRERQLA